jgi:hypothetical protein
MSNFSRLKTHNSKVEERERVSELSTHVTMERKLPAISAKIFQLCLHTKMWTSMQSSRGSEVKLQRKKQAVLTGGDKWTRRIKGNVKLSLCLTKHHAMKTYWGSGGIAPHILDLGTRCRWVISFTPRPLYPQGKSPWYPLDRRLGGPQSRSGRGGEEKNSHPPPGIEP